ncbi:endocuticle structural glycoprotein SgAbd-2-like [Chelonus insularis]|uniref:endocuticle structural glycoprotein SgAbd-2-like n=1 Tax=Chelonus insularis TaxID=460826 RepID=UPI0015893F0D|nr:endocuticle structural glycoprotein SgAbd-2-like [Chelonus insularis]
MRLFVLLTIVGVAVAQNQFQGRQNQQQYQEEERRPQGNDRQFSTTTFIPILQWNKEQEHDGTYRTSYETGNNIIAEESGYIKTFGEGEDKVEGLVQQGSYSYTSPEGQIITVHYTADETGFHAQGDHIPTPPPVSEEIQKGLDLIYAGIRKQEEAAARETALKSQQPLNQQIDRQDDRKFRL